MKILDCSAGRRAIWFNKRHPLATFVDIRPEVEPDHVADSGQMGFLADQSYDLAVFDPPHVNGGANSHIARDYGHHTTEQIREIIRRTGRELARVLKRNGLLALKWNDHDQKLEKILALMPDFEPLFGHKVAQRNKRLNSTWWALLRNTR